jgi:hypothetical protein
MVGRAVNLADVMDDLATQLDTIAGLRVHAHPPGKITPPAAVVTYPETYDFDQTYARGMDRLELPVVVLVGKVSARASRDDLARFCDGSGADSVKAVLEAGTYTAFDTVRVTKAEFDIIAIASVEYLAATFTVDITGSGA